MTKHRNHTHETAENLTDLASDARALLSATANVAGDEVAAARERVADALDSVKETYIATRNKAVAGAKSADKVIRANPYTAIGVAFGVGAIVGFFLSRRNNS